jgi:hypothetical protein
VAIVVTAQAAGIDPNVVAGHWLRSGMASSAASGGAAEPQIMNQTGHNAWVLRREHPASIAVQRQRGSEVGVVGDLKQ